MRVIVDTDVWSEAFRKKGPKSEFLVYHKMMPAIRMSTYDVKVRRRRHRSGARRRRRRQHRNHTGDDPDQDQSAETISGVTNGRGMPNQYRFFSNRFCPIRKVGSDRGRMGSDRKPPFDQPVSIFLSHCANPSTLANHVMSLGPWERSSV